MSSMKFPDIGKPFVTRQDTCLFPAECDKSRQCENWLRNGEGCEAASARQKRFTPAERTNTNSRIRLSLTPRQFDHIVAALRAWQASLRPTLDLLAIATEHGVLMSSEEIDAFIEEINR